MTSSLASCVSAAVHAPRSVQNFKNSRRPNKDVNGGVDTTKSSRRRFGKLRQRGKLCAIHDASVATEELERTSRNAGPRSVHFPDSHTSASAGYDAPWISHRADEVPVSPQQSNIVHCIASKSCDGLHFHAKRIAFSTIQRIVELLIYLASSSSLVLIYNESHHTFTTSSKRQIKARI